MQYAYTRKQLDRPRDLARPRPRPHVETKPVDAPGVAATEGTSEQLRSFVDGQLEAVSVAGRYELRRVLGKGGMATVFEAYDSVLARRIALKVLEDVHAGEPRLLARFLAEARMTARLRHPNIVEALDFGTTRSGIVYLTMELLHGEDLRRKIAREGSLSWQETQSAMLDVCAGLEAAHAAGIVHRDLKPSNCFWVADGEGGHRVRILDFGIATKVESGTAKRLTAGGHILGTPDYMSPEQVRGEVVDHRADIYALGAILGEMLTGHAPYPGKTREAILAAHLYEPRPTLRSLANDGRRFPAALEAIFARAMSKDPSDRFPDVASFARALREVGAVDADAGLGWRPSCARPRWLGPAIAAALAFVAGIAGGSSLHAEVASTPTPTPVVELEPSVSADAVPVTGSTLIPLEAEPAQPPTQVSAAAIHKAPPAPQRPHAVAVSAAAAASVEVDDRAESTPTEPIEPADAEAAQVADAAVAQVADAEAAQVIEAVEAVEVEPELEQPAAAMMLVEPAADDDGRSIELLSPEPTTDAPALLLDSRIHDSRIRDDAPLTSSLGGSTAADAKEG